MTDHRCRKGLHFVMATEFGLGFMIDSDSAELYVGPFVLALIWAHDEH